MAVLQTATAVGVDMTAMVEMLELQEQYETEDRTWHYDHELHMLGISLDTVLFLHDADGSGSGDLADCCC